MNLYQLDVLRWDHQFIAAEDVDEAKSEAYRASGVIALGAKSPKLVVENYETSLAGMAIATALKAADGND